jgi:hypothetical protein
VVGTGFFGAGVDGAGMESGDWLLSGTGTGAGGFGGTVTGADACTRLCEQPEHKNPRQAATAHVARADEISFSVCRERQIRGRVESGLDIRRDIFLMIALARLAWRMAVHNHCRMPKQALRDVAGARCEMLFRAQPPYQILSNHCATAQIEKHWRVQCPFRLCAW